MQAFRALPSVDQVLASEAGRGLIAIYGRAATLAALRARLEAMRAALRSGEVIEPSDLSARLAADLA
ncbi:MAG: L-seryl-tRNA(Sec) selenium transferase, partial [Albidovulum sp.]